MKQDVNFLLLSLLLIALMGMAAIALYAQSEYQKLIGMNSDARVNLEKKSALLDNKTSEVDSMRQELESRQQALVDMVKELNLTKEKQESLGGFFNDLRGVKASLEENLTAVQEAKSGVERSLAASRKDLEVCQVTVNFKDKQLSNSSSRISKLTNQIASYSITLNRADTKLGQINSGLTITKSALTDYENQLNNIRSDLRSNKTTPADAASDISDIVSAMSKTQDSMSSYVTTITDLNKEMHSAWQTSLTT